MGEESKNENFFLKLKQRVDTIESLLCVGLDPHTKELFPDIGSFDGVSEEARCDAAFTFCKTLIDATAPYAACYKPNAAFFEALGDGGVACLKRVLKEIPSKIPILLDVKRGDIGSTAAAYAEASYEEVGADAVTLSPLMGWDSIAPFVTEKYANKGAFLLCKTSNPGSNDLLTSRLASNEMLYEKIAGLVAGDWGNETKNLGLVVGATDVEALRRVRAVAGEAVWILAPGVGAQGGNLAEAAASGMNKKGSGMLIPVSRGISRADDPAEAAKSLMAKIRSASQAVSESSSANEQANEIQGYQRDFIEFSLAQGVLKFGSFVLKSGRTSPYFFNAGLFASGGALHKLAKAYASSIMESKELTNGGKPAFDVIFGPAYKGISLGAVVCASLFHDFGVDVGFAYNRKEAKDHGEGGTLVGTPMKGKKVLIVDDVITAGTAIRESYSMLEKIEATPVGVSIALDRAEKRSLDDELSAVQAVARDLKIPVISIVNLPQLQIFLEKSPKYDPAVLQSVTDYRAQYGV